MGKSSLLAIKFEGAADLEAALRELGEGKAIRSAIGKALLAAAEPAAKEARSRAPRKTNRLAEGIDVSTTLSRRQRGSQLNRFGSKLDPYAVFVFIGAHPMGPAVIQEFGTAQRHWKNGKSTGAVPAHPFMRPAWENHKFQILADFAKYLWVTIEAEATRIARKQARLIAQGNGR